MIHLFFHELHPPLVKRDADLDFVLRVAFGSGSGNCARPRSLDGVWHWARQLGLEWPVADRLYALQSTPGARTRAAGEIEELHRKTETARLAREEIVPRLSTAVEASGIEVVRLRRPPLDLQRDRSGWDTEAEINILVQGSDIEKLTLALVNAGCSVQLRNRGRLGLLGGAEPSAAFVGHRGAALVLHRELKFLRMVPGGVFIDLTCLKRCGLLLRDDVTQDKNIWVTSRAVQAADIIAQLLVQQRFSPEYCALQALIDAQSLGLGRDEDLAFDAYLLLQTDVEYAEYEALRELLRALENGEPNPLSSRAQTLFNHVIAAATLPSYRARLRLQRSAQKWQHDGHLDRAAERVGRAVRFIRRR